MKADYEKGNRNRWYNGGMVFNTIIRRCAAWIACIAMLFAAMAPSMSHAMSVRGGDAWTEICSAAGIKMVPAADGQGDPATSVTLDHCAFCATHPTHIALLPGNASSMPLLLGRDSILRSFSSRHARLWPGYMPNRAHLLCKF